MSGLFAGTLLHRAGHDVTIHERSPGGLEGRGAGLVAQEEVFALLRRIGREDAARVGVVAHERITLARGGEVIHRDRRPQMQISWDGLHAAVKQTLPASAYVTGRAARSAGTAGERAWIELEDGARRDGDLVLGADGMGSHVRAAVTAPDLATPVYAGYVAWRFLVPEAALARSASAVLSERFAFFHHEGGQALGYLVPGPAGETEPGQRRYNAVWYRRVPDLAAALTGRDGDVHAYSLGRGQVTDEARAAIAADAARLLPPPFAEVVSAEPEPFVQAIFDLGVRRMVRERVALLGDAAFVARPHTAMGVAKAAGDAMALVDAIREEPTLTAALARYESERRRVGEAILAYGQRLGAELEPRGPRHR